ncbi:LRR receptor-like serine/threonine-protein kinase GSO1 isoform X2 [Diospyros lotus]|uniref:LRR receptor-like serine/threonine-protein kinase GSO1 isoform X2 n=1 Tax=Diospyros lotus TaxID=55363 RepID=UPI002259DCE1|nr:LRR receptor-like serine/threonine-protein kinase GSO1 isoform X2 [Diospyros lotus]
MGFLCLILTVSTLFLPPILSEPTAELGILLAIKASLDPQGRRLSSWSAAGDPCDGSFEGVACDERGRVVNISLQGKGLAGELPPEIGLLERLSGLYLHFNKLHGVLPKEIANLSRLADLYLNVNNLSGEILPHLGNMSNLQVLQLCCNKLTGSLPTELGSLEKLSVLALQYNQLTGAIPASLGDLRMLQRMDLSFNRLFGSIPVKLDNLPMLEVLDIRNNTLSGRVPKALKRLKTFLYANNMGLCGVGFASLESCSASDGPNPNRPEPFGPVPSSLPKRDIPVSANCKQAPCSNEKIASTSETTSNGQLSTDQAKRVYRKTGSPLISLDYANGWDPLDKGWSGTGLSQEVFGSFLFNIEDIESATQHFSEVNLLGKSRFSTTYKGILRDRSAVAIKCIAKSSCKSDEAEFVKGLKILISLEHENLLRLRGFCCSKDRGECFLIYDFVPDGNLLQFLDLKPGSGKVLEWSPRKSIIHGIAKGIGYLHANKEDKPAIVHQNISAEKVLIDLHHNPFLSDAALHNLLADDIIFAALKDSAAMGYLAPEYTSTGRFTENSDVYAFGVVMFQILSGRCKISRLTRRGADSCKFEDFMDANLNGSFSESEAAKLGKIAFACTHESPSRRPAMEFILQELSSF